MAAMANDPHAQPEILVIGGQRRRLSERLPGWPTRDGSPRRWPWIAACALLLAVGAVIAVVRPQIAVADFRVLQSRWYTGAAIDAGRFQAIGRLVPLATPTDVPYVKATALALQRQEADQLARLRAEVPAAGEPDGRLAALAAAERNAWSREIGELRGNAPITLWSATAYADIARVQALLVAGQQAYGVRALSQPHPARLTAADAAIRRLSEPIDSQVQGQLLIIHDNFAQVIDLATGKVRPAPAAVNNLLGIGGWPAFGGQWPVLPRAGFLVVQPAYSSSVSVISADLKGSPRQLGGSVMLPAASPAAVWVGNGSQLVMVTRSGRRIAGPVAALPSPLSGASGPAVTGLAVTGGQIIQMFSPAGVPEPAAGLWLWNPLRGPQLRALVPRCAWPLAAQAALLAWLSCSHGQQPVSLHIVNTATGADREITNPHAAFPYLPDPLSAAFSPNGRWLAAYYARTWFGGNAYFALGLVNVATGMTSIVPGAEILNPGQASPMLWTSDSTRLFFETGAGSGDQGIQTWDDAAVPFATYLVGARAATDVRFHATSAALIAMLPVPAP
jgi:hypothetical protein